ncbi:hypothetical protein M3Y97_00598000 [Aphelenchoides bicaudatus]|nr:hypothetical protein M3Y97_00598000 [Aphelenchoides bicaudatus]
MDCSKKSFQCHLCDRTFNRQFNFKRHIKTHDNPKPKKPFINNKPCSSEDDLQTLALKCVKQEVAANNDLVNIYSCHICGKTFNKKFNFKRHHLKMHSETTIYTVVKKNPKRVFPCLVCKEKYTTRFNLRRHTRRFHPTHKIVAKIKSEIESENEELNNHNDLLLNQAESLIKRHECKFSTTKPFENAQADSLLCKFGGVSQARMASNVTEEYLKKLTTLENLAPNSYRANFLRGPNGRTGNAYGGLLFAQTLLAGHLTTNPKFVPHSQHCFFILNVDSTGTVEYDVEHVRDGRSFATRFVTAKQNGKTAMSSQISFCVPEDTSIEHQIKMPIVAAPEELISVADFCKEKLELYHRGELELPTKTVQYFENTVKSAPENIFEVRNTDPMRYFGLKPVKSIEPYYFWVKPNCHISESSDHRFLIAYLTDMTLASAANRPHSSLGYVPSMVLSLDHTVHFHSFDYDVNQWLLYENFSTWASHGRAFSEGRLWTRDGKLIVSTSQESLNRTRGQKSSI